ncbi:trypsin-like peptidase domain-containing protein [Anatilimnocola aggregata]|nr:trypsin-like peptidase domain-containing protein [Anatilimnocola aggregata]
MRRIFGFLLAISVISGLVPQVLLAQDVAAKAAPLSLADLIEKVEPSCVRVDVTQRDGRAIGSGFVVRQGDWVVTNYHVVAGSTKGEVSFADGTKGEIEGYLALDKRRDVAVLKVKLAKLREPLNLSALRPRKGESAVAIGAPRGLSFTASEGIIGAVRTGAELREFGNDADGTWLQISVPISAGSSGGPLLNLSGEVVGANTASLATAQNVNFAISAADIGLVLDQAAKNKVESLTKIEPQPSSRPTRGPMPGSPTETPAETVVVKLPAERRFGHKYKIGKEVDEFDKITWLRTMWIPLRHNDARLKTCGLRIGVPYDETGPAPAIIWELGVTSSSFAFLGGNARRFQLLLDDKSVELSEPKHKGDILPGLGAGCSERMTSIIRLDAFAELVKAKVVKVRLGTLEFTLGNEELECFRELAANLPTGSTTAGDTQFHVERYPLEDDPTAPTAIVKVAKAKAAKQRELEAKAAERSAEFRRWSSADGNFTVEAQLIKVDGANVQLKRKDNGKELTVPSAALGKADQEFLASLREKAEP